MPTTESLPELDEGPQVVHRTAVGELLYICQPPANIMHSVREICQHRCYLNNTESDAMNVKRSVRHLKSCDMIRSGGVFFVAARPAKPMSREASTLELDPMTATEVEQAALAREHAAFGVPGPAAGATLDGDGEPTVRIRVPTSPGTPSAEERALH